MGIFFGFFFEEEDEKVDEVRDGKDGMDGDGDQERGFNVMFKAWRKGSRICVIAPGLVVGCVMGGNRYGCIDDVLLVGFDGLEL